MNAGPRPLDPTVARLTGPAGWWGCLMVNTAVELVPRDRKAAESVKTYLELQEEAFYRTRAPLNELRQQVEMALSVLG